MKTKIFFSLLLMIIGYGFRLKAQPFKSSIYVYGNAAFPLEGTVKPDIGFGYMRNYSQKRRLNISGNVAQSPVLFTMQLKVARDYKLLGYGKLRLYGSPYSSMKYQTSRMLTSSNIFSLQAGIQPSLEYSLRSKIQFIGALPISFIGISNRPTSLTAKSYTAGATFDQTQFTIGCRFNVLNSDKMK
jgi:hypothetical protein